MRDPLTGYGAYPDGHIHGKRGADHLRDHVAAYVASLGSKEPR